MKSQAYLEGRKSIIKKTPCPYPAKSREETDWLFGQYDARFGVIDMREEPEEESEEE
jgi:hypothetical protein